MKQNNNMKKSLLFSILLLQVIIIKGQQYYPFPDSNAIWHHSFTAGMNWPGDTSYYYSYGLIGDTIISSLVYSKVYLLNDTTLNLNATYSGCLREDSLKKVFYIGKDFWGMENFTQEIQLYDFSKNVGDSIDYGIWGKCAITSVDSIMIGQHYRKRFTVLWDTIIEGIGCLYDLLSPINPIPTKYYAKWELVCFKQEDEVLFLNPDYPACFPPAYGIDKNPVNSNYNIKIYPQPLTHTSYIDLTGTKVQFRYLTIYNILGRSIYRLEISNKKIIQLNKTDFISGLHLYKLETNDGQCTTGKIMIE
jgi:hypothetical protein